MRALILAMLVIFSATPTLAECPAGAYEQLGHNGTHYCRRNVVGLADGVEACPAGTRPAVERGTTRVCEKIKPVSSRLHNGPLPY